ncbi:hypothetical protein EUGRSUZ_J02603 [Eucalyptus grandis]|uniref:Uncharacterized protein n=2 Tax=Eucalyptus grandis TaxID=71139 RepID=A0ACC3J9A4_EUCGR|nr:hypothetical protein EUGRSUZ_J02603 [Eucalyptus grandis]
MAICAHGNYLYSLAHESCLEAYIRVDWHFVVNVLGFYTGFSSSSCCSFGSGEKRNQILHATWWLLDKSIYIRQNSTIT